MTTSPGASSARPDARFVDTVVLPVPPFGASTHITCRLGRSSSVVVSAVRRRPAASSTWSNASRSSASGASGATTSRAPGAQRLLEELQRRLGDDDHRDVGAVGVEGRDELEGVVVVEVRADGHDGRVGAGELGDDATPRWPRAGRPASSGGDRPWSLGRRRPAWRRTSPTGWRRAGRRSLCDAASGRPPARSRPALAEVTTFSRSAWVRAKVTKNLPVGAAVTSFLFGWSPLLPSICTLVTSTLPAIKAAVSAVGAAVVDDRRRSPRGHRRAPGHRAPARGRGDTVAPNMPAGTPLALVAAARGGDEAARHELLAGEDVDRGDLALERLEVGDGVLRLHLGRDLLGSTPSRRWRRRRCRPGSCRTRRRP